MFTQGAADLPSDPLLDAIAVTDSVPPRLYAPLGGSRLEVVPCGPLFAEAIRRMHEGGSITDLVEHGLPPYDANG